MNRKIENIPVLWLIIIGTALIIGSGWWFWVDDIKPYLDKNKESQIYVEDQEWMRQQVILQRERERQEVLRSEAETSTWKTYRNEKYGFEFRYPADFIAYKEFSGDEIIIAGVEDNEVWVAKNSNLLRTGEFSSLGVNIASTNLSPRAWLDRNKKDYTDENEIKSIRDIKFAGRDAVELNGACNPSSVCKLIVVRISNYLAIIISNGAGGEFDQILSTFKFIK